MVTSEIIGNNNKINYQSMVKEYNNGFYNIIMLDINHFRYCDKD